MARHLKRSKKGYEKFISLYKSQRAEKEGYERYICNYYLKNSVESFDTLISTLPKVDRTVRDDNKHDDGIIGKLTIIRNAVNMIMQNSINYDRLLTYQNGN